MRICIEDIYPQGFLPFLPSRYLLWFQYAAVFLLKVSLWSRVACTAYANMGGAVAGCLLWSYGRKRSSIVSHMRDI
jgi:hypothetical protein